MSKANEQLLRCFASVFPSLQPDELRSLSVDSTGLWDSLATVTLVAVIEEECGVSIDPEILPELTSYQAFLDNLEKEQAR